MAVFSRMSGSPEAPAREPVTLPQGKLAGAAAALELDVLRGFAACLMIVNHAGFKWLAPQQLSGGGLAMAVFLGGFAPVLFFFATGFGTGLGTASKGRASPFIAALEKAVLLIVADQFLFWRSGVAWGLDFFGFIALSLLLVSAIARSSASVRLACALAVGAVLLRFALAPLVRHLLPATGVLAWATGATGRPDISYRAAPWFVYPAIGYALGYLYAGDRHTRWIRLGLAITAASALGAVLLAWRGISFHRWGSVNLGFFVASWAVLGASGIAAMWLARHRRSVARVLGLRGVGSFAVVPIHYALLEAWHAIAPGDLSAPAFVLAVVALVVASLWLSARFDEWVAISHVRFDGLRWKEPLALLLLVACGAATWLLVEPSPQLAFAFSITGQLAVAYLLAKRAQPLTRLFGRPRSHAA